jgi:8-oxo-dGTP pyrophosphatase MutT (NUDIX family)
MSEIINRYSKLNYNILISSFKMPEIINRNVRLNYNDEQTPELCLAAVQQEGKLLKFVKEQTHEICLTAVSKDGNALQFVKQQTPEICLAAVKQNGDALHYVNEQTQEICLEAVKQNGTALRFVKNISVKVCKEAVKQNGEAIRKNGFTLKYVKQTSNLPKKYNEMTIRDWIKYEKTKYKTWYERAGFIILRNGLILLVQNRLTRKWSFPKGTPEPEDKSIILNTAARKTYEEVGLIPFSDYFLDMNDKPIMLGTNAYYTFAHAYPHAKVKISEETIMARWFTIDEILAIGNDGNKGVRHFKEWISKNRDTYDKYVAIGKESI